MSILGGPGLIGWKLFKKKPTIFPEGTDFKQENLSDNKELQMATETAGVSRAWGHPPVNSQWNIRALTHIAQWKEILPTTWVNSEAEPLSLKLLNKHAACETLGRGPVKLCPDYCTMETLR